MSENESQQFFSRLSRRSNSINVIHYSCESLYDDNVGLSPRVTSIAVLQFATGQLLSYSIHIVAERLGISRENIISRYNDIERELLNEFYLFVRDHRGDTWVHWNMNSIAYGFEMLEHRYAVLNSGSSPPAIPTEQRINLPSILRRKYGKFASDKPSGKMLSLMLLNGERHRHFLTGPEEVEAFKNQEFSRLHMSVMTKVHFFRDVMNKAQQGRLKTASNALANQIDRLLDSRSARILTFIAAVVGLGVLLIQFLIFAFNSIAVGSAS